MNLWFKISKKSSIGRKSITLAKQIPRALRRAVSKPNDFALSPPVIANSFPKSGTHLLVQILEAFPETKNYGTFIASMPSITFRERSRHAHRKLISNIVPGEVVSAHLFYDSMYQTEMDKKQCVHFFIYRDPRDVVVSEAHYLTFMNRWHRLHPYFKALSSNEDRIMFSIIGASDEAFPYFYSNVADRFKRYEGWLQREDVFCLKFEELISEKREELISQMVEFYGMRVEREIDRDKIVVKALQNINPQKSHTFREGKPGAWRQVFKVQHKEQMKAVAGELLIRLGYEKDLKW